MTTITPVQSEADSQRILTLRDSERFIDSPFHPLHLVSFNDN